MKKIDLLADIRPEKKVVPTSPTPDSLANNQPDSTTSVITLTEPKTPLGPIFIEDYSPTKNTLQTFHSALLDSKTKKVRIAFFGDSFIEGDILCGSFRDTLQAIFGGRGVGYVPMASEVAQFRMSIRHTYENWETYSLVNKKNAGIPLGFPGYCFVPLSENSINYHTPKKSSRPFENFRLFYRNHAINQLRFVINDSLEYTQDLAVSDSVTKLSLSVTPATSLDLRFEKPDSLWVYGGSFEDGPGVYVDNMAMRGNSGMGLSSISDSQIHQFNSHQNYRLVILQYGLNVVSESDSLGYDWYVEKMVKVVNKLRLAMPQAAILLLGVSDRSSNQDGTFATIPAIPKMRDAQRKIAQRTQVAFWDTFDAMGGSGTMVNYVNSNPPLAAKDYTHLTYLGGRKIAKKLADALLHDFKKNAKKSNQ